MVSKKEVWSVIKGCGWVIKKSKMFLKGSKGFLSYVVQGEGGMKGKWVLVKKLNGEIFKGIKSTR